MNREHYYLNTQHKDQNRYSFFIQIIQSIKKHKLLNINYLKQIIISTIFTTHHNYLKLRIIYHNISMDFDELYIINFAVENMADNT
ncbi:hypothetical protein LV89_03173 [Arcicella aurantiaca]|uniref:Uncharacterized protein n=1 Tax=Arcicella aurantiaca TaxID=591202 RepID=A0A316E045_9BACT|nr:hypothetical protein LV89_03173 [Arcicella aurantiaca]